MINKHSIREHMKRMRQQIEAARTMSFEAACLLYDCCSNVGFTEGETQYVMGGFLFAMVDDVLKENEIKRGHFNE